MSKYDIFDGGPADNYSSILEAISSKITLDSPVLKNRLDSFVVLANPFTRGLFNPLDILCQETEAFCGKLLVVLWYGRSETHINDLLRAPQEMASTVHFSFD